ncbi:hypothetical protein T484DRAFT_2271693 [Baffinella frigidus]|nr:hypothetical protein T484DRAFT_2271693 [Cryptophyta sp. CCMP2293]
MGGYPWQDAQQWLEAAVRPALHEWTQSHKRELGHHGLREMGELNESLRVIKYELQERRGGADGEWFADLDATLETKSGARLSLSVSAELLGDTDESMMVAGARVQLLWGERLLVEFVGRTNMAVGEGPRGKSAWIEVGDCGGNALDDSGASALSSGGEGGVKESGKPLSERGASGLSEGRVLTDSAALVEACAALTPWIDSLPDFVECVCGIAVMPEGDVARAFRTITIEEVVEEQCWLEEEGGESGDESGGEQGGHADQKSRPNAGCVPPRRKSWLVGWVPLRGTHLNLLNV